MSYQGQKIQEFDIICKLGQGSFSIVYKVKRLSDGQFYAMKKVKLNMLKEKEKQNALNEVRILASLNQRYVIGYKEAFIEEESNTLCIIMEYAETGDIHDLIKQKIKNQSSFNEQEIWKAIVHMTQGLKTLHEKSILHRDLKCANVFQTKEGVYKLGDLNVSKVAKRGLVYTQTGTPYYASPEVWRDEPYDAKSDIWSLGCVIYEMCALRPPFTANNMAGLYSRIQKGVYPPIPNRYSHGLQQVLAQLLRLNSSTRPSCDQILHNPHVLSNAALFLDYSNQQSNSQLLKTIHLPKNGKMKELSEQLPKQKYESSRQRDKENHQIDLPKSKFINKDQSKNQFDEVLQNKSYLVNGQKVQVNQNMEYEYHNNSSQISQIINNRSLAKAGQMLALTKPPLKKICNQSPTVSNRMPIELDLVSQDANNNRLLRVNSVQEETPRMNQKASRRPTSQYIKNCSNNLIKDKNFLELIQEKNPVRDKLTPQAQQIVSEDRCFKDVYNLQSLIVKKERRLIQPIHKIMSDINPCQNNSNQEIVQILNNRSYLNELPKLIQYKDLEDNSYRRYERKNSPYMAPKVAIAKSSPFQILLKENKKPKQNNSYLQNDYYINE